MAASNEFQQEQRGVTLRMVAALCVTVLASTICLYAGGAVPATLPERVIVAARADVFVLFWLAAATGNVARLGFFSAEDIAGSGSGPTTVPVHVALAVLVASSIPLIIALTVAFAIGRLLFWIGFARGARARAFGLALTFYPSLAGLGIAIFAALGLPL